MHLNEFTSIWTMYSKIESAYMIVFISFPPISIFSRLPDQVCAICIYQGPQFRRGFVDAERRLPSSTTSLD